MTPPRLRGFCLQLETSPPTKHRGFTLVSPSLSPPLKHDATTQKAQDIPHMNPENPCIVSKAPHLMRLLAQGPPSLRREQVVNTLKKVQVRPYKRGDHQTNSQVSSRPASCCLTTAGGEGAKIIKLRGQGSSEGVRKHGTTGGVPDHPGSMYGGIPTNNPTNFTQRTEDA